ncbi:flagellar export chaperone FliS [Bermanella sp. WJH001]|uniref:flagellar export chaperone FliS n=1 Tax=Bermanella sp. WJH001 TaxID=3048005 RepID=UPI0024BEF745|nr:flagellar export chaperone FliS [Bermanella sp. WJH001]MDJ1539805.1 flagellar export chaperone FliS [Bermanella sp. WJH001]
MYTKGAKEYSQVSLQTEVMEADPHKLIQLLLEGALTRLSMAKNFIEKKEYAAKNEKIGRAIDIICALQESLDHERGGEISVNLERLYDYMTRRLFEANSKNDLVIINEVMGLLSEVKSGWEGIRASYEEIKGQGKLQPAPEQNHLSV